MKNTGTKNSLNLLNSFHEKLKGWFISKQVPTPSPSNTPRVSLKKTVAVSDVVVERNSPSTSGSSNSSGEASKTPVTQVLSRFRATRVQQ